MSRTLIAIGIILISTILSTGLNPLPAEASFRDKFRKVSGDAGKNAVNSDSLVETVTPLLSSLAARGVDFPVASTSAGYVYTYNADVDLYERSPSLGPTLVERANTTGARQWNLGLSYLYADITRVDGKSIEDVARAVALFEPLSIGNLPGARETLTRFTLRENIWDFNATYGITERWDVNVLVPVIWTVFGADASVESSGVVGTGHSGDSSRVGVGDVLLRTKYRFDVSWPLDLATMLTLRMPTGSRDNFQGLEHTTVTPWLIVSKVLSQGDVHANLGFEADADDVAASVVRYALGCSWQPIAQLAFLADVIGNSGISNTSDVQTVTVGAKSRHDVETALHNNQIEFNSVDKNGSMADVTLPVPRADIVNISIGLKFGIGQSGLAYAGVLMPLTNDGVRAEFAPTAGIQFGF